LFIQSAGGIGLPTAADETLHKRPSEDDKEDVDEQHVQADQGAGERPLVECHSQAVQLVRRRNR